MENDGSGSSGNEQYASEDSNQSGKRIGHRHTPQQIQGLEAFFMECPHPDEAQQQQLCEELKLGPDQVKFWFQNKRTQCKAQQEKTNNLSFREENEILKNKNKAMLETLSSALCPDCGGPPFGIEERALNFQKLFLENARLKEQRDIISHLLSNMSKRPTVGDSLASDPTQHIFDHISYYGINPSNMFNPSSSFGPPTSLPIQPQPLSPMHVSLLSETAASAVEELKRLFFTEEQFWVKSSIDGTDLIDSENYEKFSNAVKKFRGTSAHVESSKDVTVVPIEATNLIEMFLDAENWKELFPTMVNKAKTLHVLGSELPIRENCNILRVMWEQLHILSPLVPPREFMIVRCCQEISKGLWIIADVSHNVDFDVCNASCYKRPSGCLIQSLPNAQSKVMWIEHVEVAHKLDAHKIYRELLSGGSGYGAKRWIATLERMCERMALTSNLTLPASDWSEVIRTGEERRRVLKLGERMIMNFNEMLTMSGKVDFPQQSKCGVRVSMRMNLEAGQPPGLIVSAASSLRIPLPPVQVFDILRKLDTRQQWDVLAYGTVVTEIARVATGSSETNCLSILRPTQEENNGKLMAQDSDKDDMLMLQDCYMDALGGMLVYAPMDMATMDTTLSGADVKISDIPILPSGFIISSDGRRSTVEDGETLLTLAFQILVSGKTSTSREVNERSVDTVSALISSTVQRIKGLLNCPDQF